jgi:flagellin-specific chaperone FliS
MDIHVYIHNTDDKLVKKVNKLMATMNDLRSAVERNNSLEDSVLTMLQGISQQLKDAQAQNDPQAIQQVIDQLDANNQRMADAVAANTPAENTQG